jgi:hypothetical protein
MVYYYKLLQVDDQGIGAASYSAMCTSAISGGDLVSADAQNGVVAGSDKAGYETTDIHVRPCDLAQNCVGIALTDAAISGIVAIATQGIFLLPAGSNEFRAGSKISACGYDHAAVETCGDESGAHVIGTALTTGSTGHSASVTSLGVVRLHI